MNRFLLTFDIEGGVNYFVSRAFVNGKKPPYLNPKVNKNLFIFNEGLINWDSTIYIVEGVFEMFSLYNAVPQLGKSLSNLFLKKLIDKRPNVVVALDPDAYVQAMKIYNRLKTVYVGDEEKVKIIKINGDNDLDEIRRNQGRNVLQKTIMGATDLTTEDYIKLKQETYWNENRYNRSY
jgi:DNA primase